MTITNDSLRLLTAASILALCGGAAASCNGQVAGEPDGGSKSSTSSSGSTSGSSTGSSSGPGTTSGSGSTSSSGGSTSGSSSGPVSSSSSGSGSSSGAPTCVDSPPPAGALQAFSFTLTAVDLGDETPDDWMTIGFDLDGKCTSATSTDACTLSPGSAKVVQADGAGGIDNSWGANICPILDTVEGSDACSSKLAQVYVATDATGSGTMSISFGNAPLQFPIHDAHLVQSSGGGGVLAAVAPTTGVVSALHAAAGQISTSLCSGSAFQSIAQQIEQASDILQDGTNLPGQACDAISIGVRFGAAAPFDGNFPPVTNPCVSD